MYKCIIQCILIAAVVVVSGGANEMAPMAQTQIDIYDRIVYVEVETVRPGPFHIDRNTTKLLYLWNKEQRIIRSKYGVDTGYAQTVWVSETQWMNRPPDIQIIDTYTTINKVVTNQYHTDQCECYMDECYEGEFCVSYNTVRQYRTKDYREISIKFDYTLGKNGSPVVSTKPVRSPDAK